MKPRIGPSSRVIGLALSVVASGLAPSYAFGDEARPVAAEQGEYRLEPQDKIDITVYQIKDLTLEKVQIDSAGNIFLPLVGVVPAAGKTPSELAEEIASRLRGQYLQSPQVAIRVTEAASQKVTVDGAVMQPGVYTISGRTTLLQAVAMAKGPDVKYADLRRVVVFRTVDGQRMAATYNLSEIRSGAQGDPEIKGNDVIVVDGSNSKRMWREILSALPGLAIFRAF